ncbi:MAG: hypothetical protein R2789_15755 [Microthrixaceae bacterium]
MGFRGESPVGFAPPITSDPPFHQIARKLLLGPFSPKAVAALEPATRETCRSLIREMLAEASDNDGVVDAATAYSQHIPVRVIARMLGLPETDGEKFRIHPQDPREAVRWRSRPARPWPPISRV